MSSDKCPHNRRKTICRECKGGSICEHDRIKSRCRDCKGGSLCEHDIIMSSCRECKGGSICEHDRIRTICKECKGGSICEHDRTRSQCKECKGSRFCKHDRLKPFCKACNGSAICKHDNIKSKCRECKGGSICEHDKIRSICKDCKGGSICPHDRIKSICKECKGGSICEHDKTRSRCKVCKGGSVCEHGKFKHQCADCNGSSICKARNDPYNTGCRTKGNRNYRGFCAHCFANIFPDDPKTLTIRNKSKEIQVVSHITSKFEGFIHDKPFYADLEGGCCATKRRIDLRRLINDTMLCVEIDENQHKSYIKTSENVRYDDLFMDYSGKYIFIRYNPDKFVDKYNKSKNPFFEKRMDVLEHAIKTHIDRINKYENTELIEIYHLFYDETIV